MRARNYYGRAETPISHPVVAFFSHTEDEFQNISFFVAQNDDDDAAASMDADAPGWRARAHQFLSSQSSQFALPGQMTNCHGCTVLCCVALRRVIVITQRKKLEVATNLAHGRFG